LRSTSVRRASGGMIRWQSLLVEAGVKRR
jgi:hypothetical protein